MSVSDLSFDNLCDLLRCGAGNAGDVRTKDKLVDGVNVTCDDTHMWLIPYTVSGSQNEWTSFSCTV